MENYFKSLYQVLKIIEYASYNKIDVYTLFDLEKLKITRRELSIIIYNILEEGLVINRFSISLGSGAARGELLNPQLTTKGYEFLEENSQMKIAYKLLKEAKEWIPGL